MKPIIEESATERLLIIYFFQLYARKKEGIDLEFNEEKLKKIIAFKSKNEMVSKELFQCLAIVTRYGGLWSPEKRDLPNAFFYHSNATNGNSSINDHPILYTSIKSINNTPPIYEAKFGFNLGCDLLDENFNILESIRSNLYDHGHYVINVYSNQKTLIVVDNYDENNGSGYLYLLYENKKIITLYHIEEKELFIDLIKTGLIGDELFHFFELVDHRLMNNKDVVNIAVTSSNGWYALQFASDELRADKEIVLKTVSLKGKGMALEYVSEELKADKEVVLAAVSSSSGWALQFASEELKADKDVVIAAVSNNGNTLQWASDELKADKDVVLTAVIKDKCALSYASKELQADKDLNMKNYGVL